MRDPRHGVRAVPCPYCGKKLDAAESVTNPENTPKAGDYTFCFYCLGLLRFDESGAPSVKADLPQDDTDFARNIEEAKRFLLRQRN